MNYFSRKVRQIPGAPARVLLVNPTRYLGNLLLAGGLMQQYAAQCLAEGRQVLLVLDDTYAQLCTNAFSGVPVLYYPRRRLAQIRAPQRLREYCRFLSKIRNFDADLAFNLEEDTVSSRLVQCSGARFRLGCSPQRQRFGYEHVLPIEYAARAPDRRHRWYSYEEVFAALGLQSALPSYLNLHINQLDGNLIKKLEELGTDFSRPLVAVHPSATKDYKQWPESSFIKLCNLLINNNFHPLILGAGAAEATRCAALVTAVESSADLAPVNLCNRLNLSELAALFRYCSASIGNDSGPSHLAAAQGLPGIVIFGPSDAGIWGPLGGRSVILQRRDLCEPGCSRRTCLAAYRCLHGIEPVAVLEQLLQICQYKPAAVPVVTSDA